MSYLEDFSRMCKEAIDSLSRVTICARCVRPGEATKPSRFGDFSLCPRCKDSVTSETSAVSVRK